MKKLTSFAKGLPLVWAVGLLTGCPFGLGPIQFELNTTGSFENPLTYSFPLNFEAKWSPDGKYIALSGTITT
ncbi:MAG: hypothetical protein IV090_24850 [Candidatus Sericytochromatia bacterium]|nr:hypothetical protein [Candidatus Sericytochromatia bacterium]